MAAKRKLLTTEDVADILGVAPQTVANWRQSGRHSLPHLKIARMVRYDPAAVEDFLANSEVSEFEDDDGYEGDEDEDEDEDEDDDESNDDFDDSDDDD